MAKVYQFPDQKKKREKEELERNRKAYEAMCRLYSKHKASFRPLPVN